MTYDAHSLLCTLQNARHSAGSYRPLWGRLGLPGAHAATMSRLVRGEPVGRAARLRVARALGIAPPPRRLIRVVMSEAQYEAWRACPAHERAARLATPPSP